MSIQIIIQGNHTTDVLAEIQNLASALNGPSEVTHTVQLEAAPEKTACELPKKAPADPISEPDEEPKPKKPTAKEQDAMVDRFIEDGITNGDEFEMLTKARQKKVNDALKEASVNHDAPDADVDSMFDDEPDTAVVITRDDLRDLMGKLGKDGDGAPIQANLIQIRDILTKFIPEGNDVKIGNVPEEEIAQLHAELSAING